MPLIYQVFRTVQIVAPREISIPGDDLGQTVVEQKDIGRAQKARM